MLTFFAAAKKVSAAPHRGSANRPTRKRDPAKPSQANPTRAPAKPTPSQTGPRKKPASGKTRTKRKPQGKKQENRVILGRMKADYLRTALSFRLAAPSDAAEIARIHVKAWQAAYRSIFPAEYLNSLSIPKRRALWSELIARGMPRIMLAERDDIMLGWIAWGPSRDNDKGRTDAEIEAIYIDPAHWRQGAGRMLIDEAINAAASEGYREMTLWALEENVHGLRFYKALGFALDGVFRTERLGGCEVCETRLHMAI
ncbi:MULTISPECIES: GNAT family N-acetyltransferase [Caballeronia]|uniref:GNAT family N-acetyltransferase n=1 Tax=Caballeronia TaxID=1827195 RepID=UPI001EF5B0E7|nr:MULTISPECIES: GNAT family N-acetyltransferase [Caballeronia]MCG7405663.1 GNAT family N-acetyltransferase [Caballeronia zhejiangensis]